MPQREQVINIRKPPGPTSHDMVDLVRRATGEKTVGHAGTLDPFAEGVLLVLVGREATKRQKEFMALPKTYRATLRLGATSDTDDVTGSIMKHETWNVKPERKITLEQIRGVLKNFIGDIEQIPPAYSAVKLRGKKAYELARKGKTPVLKPRRVHIERIALIRYEWPELEVEVECGSGTYIRALARDIGAALVPPSHKASGGQGCGAYVEKLVRTRIGPYRIEDAMYPDALGTIFASGPDRA